MAASLIQKAGAEKGKTKIDINVNSHYYETEQQWKERLKSEGRDSSQADYDQEQTDLYFQKNPVKNG